MYKEYPYMDWLGLFTVALWKITVIKQRELYAFLILI